MKISPPLLKLLLNLYGPYLGAGIRVEHISGDWRRTKVSMKLKWYNRNIKKVHFGGSLYSMADPHLMLMLMQVLGKGYLVWDKSAEIDFVKPGKGTVTSVLEIKDTDIAVIKERTRRGEKYLHRFNVAVLDSRSEVVANICKVIYVRKKS